MAGLDLASVSSGREAAGVVVRSLVRADGLLPMPVDLKLAAKALGAKIRVLGGLNLVQGFTDALTGSAVVYVSAAEGGLDARGFIAKELGEVAWGAAFGVEKFENLSSKVSGAKGRSQPWVNEFARFLLMPEFAVTAMLEQGDTLQQVARRLRVSEAELMRTMSKMG